MSFFHCLDCNRKIEVFGMIRLGGAVIGHANGCHSSRVIPIATICDPPEPTVIEASDLAPGMVVVAVDDGVSDMESYGVFLCTPDARLGWCGDPRLVSATTLMSLKNLKTHFDVHYVAAKQNHS